MAERQRLPLPFGGGIDRASGAMVANAAAFNDIRNVHLTNGRAEFRKGLLRTMGIEAPWTDLLGVYLIRAQGLAAAVVYDDVARQVGLFAVDSSGVAHAFIDNLWVLPAGATEPPRISATDSYDQLVIAHDEPVFPLRQNTIVYSAVESTIGPLMLDLAREGTAYPVKFRGVQKHLAYIVGWGYGTHLDEDRGELLRISMPGEPTNFTPEHYFLVGTQGDPIIGCGPCGGELAVQKIASSKKLVGSERQSFGIRELDPAYGLQSSRLHAAVNDEHYFWSLSGPRVTNGGPSLDLGLPLELIGPFPDALADDVLPENGFAFYDAAEREVVFCFGQWAYVLHMKDGTKRWSYRQYAIALINAGLLYVGGSLGLANITAHPEFDAITYIEPTYGPGDGTPKATIDWLNVGGDGVTTETLEIWVQSQVAGSPWRRKFAGLAVLGTATISLDGFWTDYNIALRYTSGGFAAAGYVSADPANWPSDSRDTFSTEGEITSYLLGKWRRRSAFEQGFNATALVGPGQNPPGTLIGLTYRIEEWDGATWTLMIDDLTYDDVEEAVTFPNSASLGTYDIRIRPEGPHGFGAWFTHGPRMIAPEMPATLATTLQDADGANDHPDHHNIAWTAPASVNGESPADGPYEARGRHYDNFGAGEIGAWSTTYPVAAGVHVKNGMDLPGVDPSSSGNRTGEVQVRVVLTGGDVSDWKSATNFES